MKKILIITLLFLLVGCTSTRYIEVPVDRVEIEYINKVSVDTVVSRDSVIIKESGDTVYFEKYKYLYKTKELKDTLIRTDTITKVQVIESVKEVKNKFNTLSILLFISSLALLIFNFKRYGIKKNNSTV